MTDPFKMLETDHRQVERLLEQLADSEEGAERDELIAQLTEALTVHMDFEERDVYPLTARLIGPEDSEEATNEHGLTREGLAQLAAMSAEPGFGGAVATVQGGLSHHIEEEESEMFPELRKQVDAEQQANLARALVVAKRDAGLLESSLDDASKADLQEIADSLNLDARSSMSKAELRELIAST